MMAKSLIAARSIDAIDVTVFIDLLHRVSRVCSIADHAYGAMSGFALDDQRRLYRSFGLTKLLAFGANTLLNQRQMFNKPITEARRVEAGFKDVVDRWQQLFEDEGIEGAEKFILWLRRDAFVDPASGPRQFEELAGSIGVDGILRITLEVDYDAWAGPEYDRGIRLTLADRQENARSRVEAELSDFLVPADYAGPIDQNALCRVISKAYGNAASEQVAEGADRLFEPLSVVRYGSAPVELTLTGMVIPTKKQKKTRGAIRDGNWPFASADWADVKTLLVPDLTVRERIELE
ncbi:MAG: hypothetical protein EON59_07100, partial [Alphaproteobacteria bacterium]